MSGISATSLAYREPTYVKKEAQAAETAQAGSFSSVLQQEGLPQEAEQSEKDIPMWGYEARQYWGNRVQEWCDYVDYTVIQIYKTERNFASKIGVAEEKSINWDADGSAKLTKEQVKDLKSRYDITDISKQDYYNLLAELTDMNVISAKDVIWQFDTERLPFCGFQHSVTPANADQDFLRLPSCSGNMLEKTADFLNRLNTASSWLCAHSAMIDPTSFLAQKSSLDDRVKTYQNLSEIFQLIAR